MKPRATKKKKWNICFYGSMVYIQN